MFDVGHDLVRASKEHCDHLDLDSWTASGIIESRSVSI